MNTTTVTTSTTYDGILETGRPDQLDVTIALPRNKQIAPHTRPKPGDKVSFDGGEYIVQDAQHKRNKAGRLVEIMAHCQRLGQ